LALGAGLAGGGDVILIPEIPYDEKAIVEVIKTRLSRGKKSSLVVVAEGAHPKGGRMVMETRPGPRTRARLGGISRQLANHLESRSGIEARSVILGHVVRGGTPTAFDRNLATRFGVAAMDLVRRGKFNRMVALQGGEMASVPLSKVGGRNRKVPLEHEFLSAAKAIGVSFGV
jgi:6-phosphofructokinase 1